MNTLMRIFKMPWIASLRNWHSWLYAFLAFILSVNVSKVLTKSGAAQFGIAVLITALVIIWKMVSTTLWLARDARALRLPGVERDADFTLPLFALASIVLPALILGALFGNPIEWLVSMALVAAGTFGFCVLPGVLSLPLLFVAVIVLPLRLWEPPLPGSPEFLAWAVPALIALVVASLQRWIAIRRAVTLDRGFLWRASSMGGRLLQLRRLRGEVSSDNVFSRKQRKSTSGTLNRVGPDYPVRSIRTALGAYLMPLDAGRARTLSLRLQIVIAVLVLIPPMIAVLAQRHFGIAATTLFSPQLILYMAIITIMTNGLSGKSTMATLQQHHAGLSLLALLPRLDKPNRLKQDTLMACVEKRVREKLLLSLSAALVLVVLRLPLMFHVYLVLMLASGIFLELANQADILGGKSWFGWTAFALYMSAIMIPALVTQEFGVRVIHGAQPHLETLGRQALVCVALWLLWCVGFGLLALRGWRAMQRRPHPFLPIA